MICELIDISRYHAELSARSEYSQALDEGGRDASKELGVAGNLSQVGLGGSVVCLIPVGRAGDHEVDRVIAEGGKSASITMQHGEPCLGLGNRVDASRILFILFDA